MQRPRSDRSDNETPIWDKKAENDSSIIEDELYEKVRDILENDEDDDTTDIWGRPLNRSKNKTKKSK